MAIMTRCSMPPDSSAGIWWKTRSGSRRPTAVEQLDRRRAPPPGQPALHAQHLGELAPDGRYGFR